MILGDSKMVAWAGEQRSDWASLHLQLQLQFSVSEVTA